MRQTSRSTSDISLCSLTKMAVITYSRMNCACCDLHRPIRFFSSRYYRHWVIRKGSSRIVNAIRGFELRNHIPNFPLKRLRSKTGISPNMVLTYWCYWTYDPLNRTYVNIRGWALVSSATCVLWIRGYRLCQKLRIRHVSVMLSNQRHLACSSLLMSLWLQAKNPWQPRLNVRNKRWNVQHYVDRPADVGLE